MQYQIKCFDKDKTLKMTINPKIIKNKINFSKQINWWLWQFSLKLDLWIANSDFIQWDLIEIYSYEWTSFILIFVWYIEEINKTVWNYEETELKINWLASLLKRIIYNVTWNFTATLLDDPFTIASNIIAFANTKYNYFDISWSLTWTVVNYTLNYSDCYSVIEDLNNISANYYWFLNNYTLQFKAKPTIASYVFTLKKDIIELEINEDNTDMVNSLILTHWAWTNTYTDATSVSIYWIREKYISNTNIADLTSANIFWNKYLTENKNPVQKTSLIISNKFLNWWMKLQEFIENMNTYTDDLNSFWWTRIENINPWQTCKIRNINKTFSDNLLISKIVYNQEKIVLELERFDNFIWLIKQ
jgi:hypothetical protein